MLPPVTMPQVRLGSRLFGAAAASYVIDGLLLTGFAATGTVDKFVPAIYTATGLFVCAIFYCLSGLLSAHSWWARSYPLIQVIVSSSVLLGFVALVPEAGFFFLGLLFIVFGFGSLGLSSMQSFCAWIAVSATVTFEILVLPNSMTIPHSGTWVQALVCAAFLITLGRCMLLGLLGRSLRLHLQNRRRQLRLSVEKLQERDRSLALLNLELRRQATHDALTGLANRLLFVERLEQAVREGEPFAICAIDLDGFKEINDSRGHSAGDALLQSVGERLRASTRPDDTVARTGGDEFLILLRNIHCVEDAAAHATRCVKVLAAPYRIAGEELKVSCSVGVARHPIDAMTVSQLMARADEAMYRAKRSGKDTFRFYDPNPSGIQPAMSLAQRVGANE